MTKFAVLKYSLPVDDGSGFNYLTVPKGSVLLHVGVQKQNVQAWYKVPLENVALSRVDRFQVLGTGWETEENNLSHFTTIMDGPFVWHVFYQQGLES